MVLVSGFLVVVFLFWVFLVILVLCFWMSMVLVLVICVFFVVIGVICLSLLWKCFLCEMVVVVVSFMGI